MMKPKPNRARHQSRRNPLVAFLSTLTISLILIKSSSCLEDEHFADDFHLANSDSDPFAASSDREAIVVDSFHIADNLEETIEHELQSHNEKVHDEESTTRHPFQKSCPSGYFACNNGECIAAKWRCDGHYDCDDFSDELNCTTIDVPNLAHHEYHPVTGSKNMTAPANMKMDIFGLDFNSTVEPLMIFSTGNSIRGMWMRSRLYFDIVTPITAVQTSTVQASLTQALSVFFDLLTPESRPTSLKAGETSSKPKSTIVGVDMDPRNKEVFWVELGKDPGVYSSIIEDQQFDTRQRRQFHGHRKVVEFGLLSPEDIALDNVAKNAYITDAGLPAVVVCSTVYSHCKILVDVHHDAISIHKPRAIVADSSVGWIIYTDWGDHPGIFLVSMDGKRSEALIETDVVWPNGLAADFEENFLYWADARLNKIERVDLQTRARVQIVKGIQTNPFSVAMFENRIYWSDWSGNEIKSCDKKTGNNTRVVMRATDIYGIHIYHPDLHKHEPANPCWSKHCSHLCLLTPTYNSFSNRVPGSVKASCACPDSMALSASDKSTCYDVHFAFVLVNERNYIAQVFPEKIGLRTVEEIVYSKEHAIQDVAADWIHYRLFFFDATRQQIYATELASSKGPKLSKITSAGKSIRGLLYDTWSDNLYWLDYEAGTLVMYSFVGKFKKTIKRNLDRPSSLALDSYNRVFYIATLGIKPRIIRSSVAEGSGRDVTIIDSDIGLPVAIHLDEITQRLYWADAKRETIESIEVDIKSRTTGVRPLTRAKHRKRLGTILAMVAYQDSLIWTVQNDDYLYKAAVQARPESRPVTFKMPSNPDLKQGSSDQRRIIVVNPSFASITSPCSKHGCSHACIVDQTQEASCMCPDGLVLQHSNKTNCVDPSSLSAHEEEELGIVELHHGRPGPHPVAQLAHQDQEDHFGQLHKQEMSNSESGVARIRAPVTEAPHQFHFDQMEQDHLHKAEPVIGRVVDSGATAARLAQESAESGKQMVWLIALLLFLSVGGLIAVVSLLVLYRQGRLPRQVSQLSVGFGNRVGGGGSAAEKDRTMLLLDTDS